MSWKEILKYCGKEEEDPWHETEPPLPAAKDNIENLHCNTKKAEAKITPLGKKIMDEVKAEGGALGMEHLYKKFKKNFGGNKKSIERTVAYLVRNGHLFQHKDGDLYTHKPKSKGRGFTAD